MVQSHQFVAQQFGFQMKHAIIDKRLGSWATSMPFSVLYLLLDARHLCCYKVHTNTQFLTMSPKQHPVHAYVHLWLSVAYVGMTNAYVQVDASTFHSSLLTAQLADWAVVSVQYLEHNLALWSPVPLLYGP